MADSLSSTLSLLMFQILQDQLINYQLLISILYFLQPLQNTAKGNEWSVNHKKSVGFTMPGEKKVTYLEGMEQSPEISHLHETSQLLTR